MGGAVKSVSKAASKAVGGATKAVGNIVKQTAKAPGAVAGLLGGKKKVPGEAGYDAAIDGATDDSAGPAQPFGGLANQLGVERPPQAAINPFAPPKRGGFVLPQFNQMQAYGTKLPVQRPQQVSNGQPQQPALGQAPQLNQSSFLDKYGTGKRPSPMAPAPGTAPAPVAPMAPAPGLAPVAPPAIGAISSTPPAAPQAPEVKPPAPAQASPVQQQQAPGTPAPGAAPAAGASESAATISPEDQFKKTQASMYQVNK
jgi:hypothetical protein